MERPRALRIALALALAGPLGAALVAGCQDKKTLVPFVTPFTPVGPVRGTVPVFYVTQDRTGTAVQVAFEVSKDGGRNWVRATAANNGPATTISLAHPSGFPNVFLWDSFADLGPGYFPTVQLRGTGQANGATGRQSVSGFFSADESGSFTATATTGLARVAPAVVPLPDDAVLIAGGTEAGIPSAAVEVFDPVTEQVTGGGSLSAPRASIAATLLADGRVLLAGGAGVNSAAIGVVEVYARKTNSVAALGSGLVVPRFDAAIAPLRDGGAVIAGGIAAGGAATATVEVFDPATSTFAAVTSSTSAAVRMPAATTLADGRVLFTGGADGSGNATSSAFIFDPATRQATATGSMFAPRVGHRATRLADGRVLIAGGFARWGEAQTTLATSEVFEPAGAGGFTALATMREPRALHAQDLAGGRVFAIGGATASQTGEVYDPDANAWSSLPFTPRSPRSQASGVATGPGRALIAGGGQPPELYHAVVTPPPETWVALRDRLRPRAGHSATRLIVGDVVFAGGTDGVASATNTTDVYRALTGTFEPHAPLLTPRAGHASTLLLDGRVLVAGGVDASGNVLGTLEAYSPINDRWEAVPATLAVPRTGARALVVPPGDVVIVGGRDAQGRPAGTVEVFHPVAQTVETLGSLLTPRVDDDAVETFSGKVLVAGGRDANGAPVLTVEAFDPIARASTNVGSLQAGRPGLVLARAPFGFFALATGGVAADGAARADLEGIDVSRAPPVVQGGLLALDVGRAFHVAATLGGETLLSGGRDGDLVLDSSSLYVQNLGLLSNALEASVRAPRWRHMTSPRVGHSVTPLQDGRHLVVGGRDHRGVVKSGVEVYLGGAFR